MKKPLFILFITISAFGQSFTPMDLPWFGGGKGVASRWWPTNVASGMFLWLETIPFTTVSNSTDNVQAWAWTNLICASAGGCGLSADQSLRPTNFVSGGGVNGTSPRVHFEEASGGTQRLISGAMGQPACTFMFVANCDNAATSPGGLYYNGTQMRLEFNNAKLQMSEGVDTLTGPATIGTGWYIITAVYNGASSRIDTNGVTYVSGTCTLGPPGSSVYLGQFQAYKGNISRVWAWTNTLTAGEYSSAIAQCKKDYGFP